MFKQSESEQALQALKGNVEWIYPNFTAMRGLEVISRVDGELKGLAMEREEWGKKYGTFHNTPGIEYYSITPLDRERTLSAAFWLEHTLNTTFLTEAERSELEDNSKRATAKEQEFRQRQQREQEERERGELERLQRKFQKPIL